MAHDGLDVLGPQAKPWRLSFSGLGSISDTRKRNQESETVSSEKDCMEILFSPKSLTHQDMVRNDQYMMDLMGLDKQEPECSKWSEVEGAQSCPTLWDSTDCSLLGSSLHWNSPGKNDEVGCHFLLQGIFQTQGSYPSLLHCRQILHHLSHQGSQGYILKDPQISTLWSQRSWNGEN